MQARFRRVLEHIEAHPDGALTTERLSFVAGCSKFHFHRQFSALFGLSVGEHVRRVRLRRAAYQLAFRQAPLLEIALAHGYASHEAFTRAFKRETGQTPSAFRLRPRWERSALAPVRLALPAGLAAPRIVSTPEVRLAALAHRGDPAQLGDTLRQFIAWRRQHGPSPRVSATYNLVHHDHVDICAAADGVAHNTFGVVPQALPAGRWAVLRHVGDDEGLQAAARWLYTAWLPGRGEEPRDFPLVLQRVRLFPDVPESQAVTDVRVLLRGPQ
jgi:AraC family transcriptional regulator